VKEPKYAIVYLTLKADYAKLNNLPVRLPLLAEDFQKSRITKKVELEYIINGLAAQYETDRNDEYYRSYLVFYYYEGLKAAMSSGDFLKARLYLEKAEKIHKDYRFFFYSGLISKNEKDYVRAELELKECISLKKEFVPGHFELADLMHITGNDDEAVEACLTINELEPSFIPAYLKAADIYAENGITDKAFEYLKKCLEKDSRFAPAYLRIGVLLNQMQQFAQALAAFEKGCAYDPQNYEFYYNMAFSLGRLGRHLQAVQVLEKACSINPEDFVYHELAIEYKNLGMFLKAFEAEKKAFDIASQENKDLITLSLMKMAVFVEDYDTIEQIYKTSADKEIKTGVMTFKMFFDLGQGEVHKAAVQLSKLTAEGLFPVLEQRIYQVEKIVQKLEDRCDEGLAQSLLESIDEDGEINCQQLYEKLRDGKYSGEYIGSLIENSNTAKERPSGLELVITGLFLSGMNYGLAERVSATLARLLWKDGNGIAFARFMLRLYQAKVFGEYTDLDTFVQDVLLEITDLSYKIGSMLTQYNEKIMDFDTLVHTKIKKFEDAFMVLISALNTEYTLKELEGEEFEDEKTKELLVFVQNLNELN